MRKFVRRTVFWMPRILGVLYALFISLFALDVFAEGYGFWETVLALVMHLIPTGLVLIALAIAWRWAWIGAILFAALGAWYVIMAWGEFESTAYLVIAGPLFLIGALFLVSGFRRSGLDPSS